jgi:hypothetical protein
MRFIKAGKSKEKESEYRQRNREEPLLSSALIYRSSREKNRELRRGKDSI